MEFYYFECVECGRRLILTSLAVFMAPGTLLQLAILLIISVICIKAWSYTAPCRLSSPFPHPPPDT